MPRRTSLLVVPVLLLLGVTRIGYGYEDGAPPGHTGGLGEPDCTVCHADSDLNPADGALRVEGLPDRVVAESAYELAVVLKHPELRAAGFQLAIRSSDGKPSGQLVSLSDRTRVIEESGQVYLQHTKEGLHPETEGAARWVFRWIAAGVAGPVYLHVAANAANDDISALGDYIFALERIVPPEARQEPATDRSLPDQSSACPTTDSVVAGSDVVELSASSGACCSPFCALIGSSRKR